MVVAAARPVFSGAIKLVNVNVETVAEGYRASRLIGTDVMNDKGEKIGDLDDLVIDRQRVLFAILDIGGFLGLGGKLVAVPFQSLTLDKSGETIELPGATKEELEKLNRFEYRR